MPQETIVNRLPLARRSSSASRTWRVIIALRRRCRKGDAHALEISDVGFLGVVLFAM
jgi:hypothetical protein